MSGSDRRTSDVGRRKHSDSRLTTHDSRLRRLAPAALALALLLPPSARADGALDRDDVSFRVDLAPASVAVGKPITVTFEATYPAGTRLYFPEAPAVKPFVLVRHEHDATAVAGAATGEKHALTLLPVRVGTASLPPLEVPYVTASGEARVAKTPEVRIQIGSTLGNETDPQPADAGAPVPVRVRNLPLIWALSGLGVALVTALVAILAYRRWRAWRDARRPPPPPRPPHEVARERLAAIETQGLVEAGDFKQVAALVSEVIREFLGGIYGFSGVDLTSWEVLRALQGFDMGRVTPVELEDFLGFCDLVKFAKFPASADDARSLIRRAREVVERVPVPQPVATAPAEVAGEAAP